MKEKWEEISKRMSSLSNRIVEGGNTLSVDDTAFLQNYKITKMRAEILPSDPPLVSGALINVAKHLGNLGFRVWQKMKNIMRYTPVILDPQLHALSTSQRF